MARTPCATKTKLHQLSTPDRPTLDPSRNYTRAEAALAVGVAPISLFRAFDAGHLNAFRVGRRVIHSGQQLLDWLAAGGKTSTVEGRAQASHSLAAAA